MHSPQKISQYTKRVILQYEGKYVFKYYPRLCHASSTEVPGGQYACLESEFITAMYVCNVCYFGNIEYK